jgi:hypothetical protein
MNFELVAITVSRFAFRSTGAQASSLAMSAKRERETHTVALQSLRHTRRNVECVTAGAVFRLT